MSAPLVFALLDDERDLPLVEIGRAVGEVVALTAGDAAHRETRGPRLLEAAAAAGATRIVLVADPVLAGVDYLAIAHVLACAVRQLCEARPEAPVIVLAGDRGRGAVGPAVAERLAVPHLGAVRKLEFRDGRLNIDRLCSAELRRYTGAAPVLLACRLGEASGAAASSKGEPPAIEALALETLRITPPELQYRQRFRPVPGAVPPPRPHLVSNVEHLGDRLARDGLWPLAREVRREDGQA